MKKMVTHDLHILPRFDWPLNFCQSQVSLCLEVTRKAFKFEWFRVHNTAVNTASILPELSTLEALEDTESQIM
jgi:hypothetical protein